MNKFKTSAISNTIAKSAAIGGVARAVKGFNKLPNIKSETTNIKQGVKNAAIKGAINGAKYISK